MVADALQWQCSCPCLALPFGVVAMIEDLKHLLGCTHGSLKANESAAQATPDCLFVSKASTSLSKSIKAI